MVGYAGVEGMLLRVVQSLNAVTGEEGGVESAEVAVASTAEPEAEAVCVPDYGTFNQILPITILVLLGLAVPLGLMAASWLAHRHKDNNPVKSTAYECGLSETVGTADERFSIKFYLIAMLFLVFDLEVAFLYPWAVQFGAGGWGMVTVLLVFLVMLEAGYLYLYRKGALDWDD